MSSFLVSHIQTTFPSEIEVDKDTVYTVGGLILVKITRISKEAFFEGKIKVNYTTI